jgi:DNA-binding response OmpR family regulator
MMKCPDNVDVLYFSSSQIYLRNTMGTGEKVQIMITDDDAHVRIAVRLILGEAGYTVVPADSGQSCIDLLKKGFKGVILLDIMMPGMDGWDTIAQILAEDLYVDIVIVMLTAKSSPDTKMIGLQEWVLDYLTKPFDPEVLIEKIAFFSEFLLDSSNDSTSDVVT